MADRLWHEHFRGRGVSSALADRLGLVCK